MDKKYDVVIVGAGPAGLSAALYLGRAKVKTLVIDKDYPGGQVIMSPLLENIPGRKPGPGVDLAEDLLSQLSVYPSVEIEEYTEVMGIDEADGVCYTTINASTVVESDYVIIASGAAPIQLPTEDIGGIHYCVTCDGAFYEGKTTAVIGGGNSAMQYALELTKYCPKVYICTDQNRLYGEESVCNRVLNNLQIEVKYNFAVSSIVERDGRRVLVAAEELVVDGVFVAIGYKPSTNFIICDKDNRGYIATRPNLTIPGFENVYAIGDCRKKAHSQVAIAMADGCEVALDIIKKL